MTTFVAVGNATQPFARLIDAVVAIAADLPQPVLIQHGVEAGVACPALHRRARPHDVVGRDGVTPPM